MNGNDNSYVDVAVIGGEIMFRCGDTWPAASPPSKVWYTTGDTEPLTLLQMRRELEALIKMRGESSS